MVLNQDIKYLKGVGEQRAKLLAEEANIRTLKDLIYYFPYKYVDKSVIYRIADLEEYMPYIQLKGHIINFIEEGIGRKKRLKAIFTDGSGYITLVWFSGIKYIEQNYKVNIEYLIFGKPQFFNNQCSIAHPEIDEIQKTEHIVSNAGLQPVYHTNERMKKKGCTTKFFLKLIQNSFNINEISKINETLPLYLKNQYHLINLGDALYNIHFPIDAANLAKAQKRLKFEELFYLQLNILYSSTLRFETSIGLSFLNVGNKFMTFYKEILPFELTNAQKKVIKEIRKDLGSGHQMNRLLQGDVGSGKTIISVFAALLAKDNGFQACLMAPTEILAEQHFDSFVSLLEELDLSIELLTSNIKGIKRQNVLERLSNGDIDILIGTHALIESNVIFSNLGLVIIDEQHRFGVEQRAKLWKKNNPPPHVLVMTATPIPRTLAMTVYGDLKVSVIDELPPGRRPIKTLHYKQSEEEKIYAGIDYQLNLGRQVYFVFPLIEENKKIDLKDLEQGYMNLKKRFDRYIVRKIHGRMSSAEKDSIMRDFKENKVQILVSTTVIEVGVNVPNASVMVIVNAERFGLSQLHQLRGRVGRGSEQSYCILETKERLTEDSRRRMNIMVESSDGFEIAEEDLKLRGPGDINGTAQSGMPFDLKIANILKDADLMNQAREAALNILNTEKKIKDSSNLIIWKELDNLRRRQKSYCKIS